ncbi:N-acetylgalactosamine kinase [Parasteatoda tepidariorum]|uniref:N-acetylgalactosamine kinase n=1 Tax=Parasteatoda tepidariorum TaxID=114398 RepID=UPI00077FBDE6|nr:N-acetylgalactosamine kinase [Parasteatoda tepidariorum]XP_015908536.1 N-acetylgalactosamine kinase [Parasteatoda tepidariorum]XP_042909602.1 N-acetylgalactosamine kinase [Parasteatoda tepidariorum]XP_042909603.1 N-acetylgalactosamine kinase [Parasteatoda tepidariorum]
MNSFPVEAISVTNDKKRIQALQSSFEETFKSTPSFFVRSPGRVNLIGEHIDYNDFQVLPIAIEQSILIAVGDNKEKQINIQNVDEKYPSISIAFDEIQKEMSKGMSWYNYIFAAILGLADKFQIAPSFNMLVSSNLPPAAGLSSSSSLVCASAMAVAYKCHLHELHGIGKFELAELCANAEQYVGTRGGGMDQAIIFLADKGYAKKISFKPLRSVNIHLPEDLQFIVVNSGVKKEKALSSDFNKRVAECILAGKVLAKHLDLDWKTVNTLGELVAQSEKSPSEILGILDEILNSAPYSTTSICEELMINLDQLKEILHRFHFPNLETEHFELLPRARHVYTEAGNVEQFIEACEKEDLVSIGGAMNSSHQSLRYNYDCSHEKLDILVDHAVKYGALGARLTGAGWGGAMIAAVTKEHAQELLQHLKEYGMANGLSDSDIFLTKPSGGAVVIENVTNS